MVRSGISLKSAWVMTPIALVALLAGCDLTGEYERRFQETLVASGAKAVFDQQLYAADTEVLGEGGANSGVKLRIPVLFDNNSKSLPAAEARAQPPFLKIPGLNYALERALDDASNQFAPAYIYFAAVPKGDQKADQVLGPLATAVATAFPGTNWADASVKTPQGTSVTFKVLRAAGPQDFDNSGAGGAVQKLDGKFELYFVESPTHFAFIGFRAPNAQAQKYQLDSAIQAAMGTVTVAAAAAAEGTPAPAPAPMPAA